MGKHPASGVGQHRLAPAGALEEAHAGFLLEALDVGADGGLCDAEPPRGPREGATLGDRDEDLQASDAHTYHVDTHSLEANFKQASRPVASASPGAHSHTRGSVDTQPAQTGRNAP